MKSHLETKMKKQIKQLAVLTLLMIFGISGLQAQDLPVPSKPSGWVNDYANVFSKTEVQNLSQKLNVFQYNHSTQIFIVTINKNNGYPVSTLGPIIGEEWGVGQDGKDNGILLLLDMEARDVFITTGYGVEEYIPDAIAKRIVENELVPAFKQGDYYGGVNAATDVMTGLLQGKFTPDEYRAQTSSSGTGSRIGGIFFMIMIFSALFGSRRRSYGAGGRRSNLPLWMALGMMSGSRSSGSFGNFSSGSGGFGGGFGGFTGGGGGGFGGGGAGGSW
jgi:uncharacterized protein